MTNQLFAQYIRLVYTVIAMIINYYSSSWVNLKVYNYKSMIKAQLSTVK